MASPRAEPLTYYLVVQSVKDHFVRNQIAVTLKPCILIPIESQFNFTNMGLDTESLWVRTLSISLFKKYVIGVGHHVGGPFLEDKWRINVGVTDYCVLLTTFCNIWRISNGSIRTFKGTFFTHQPDPFLKFLVQNHWTLPVLKVLK